LYRKVTNPPVSPAFGHEQFGPELTAERFGPDGAASVFAEASPDTRDGGRGSMKK
jgi:hypothetical protein